MTSRFRTAVPVLVVALTAAAPTPATAGAYKQTNCQAFVVKRPGYSVKAYQFSTNNVSCATGRSFIRKFYRQVGGTAEIAVGDYECGKNGGSEGAERIKCADGSAIVRWTQKVTYSK